MIPSDEVALILAFLAFLTCLRLLFAWNFSASLLSLLLVCLCAFTFVCFSFHLFFSMNRRTGQSLVPASYNRYIDGAVGRAEVDRLIRHARWAAVRTTFVWATIVFIFVIFFLPSLPIRKFVCWAFCPCQPRTDSCPFSFATFIFA